MTMRVPVLIAGASATWEAAALETLGRSALVVVHKRCVDLPDLLASAGTGLAPVVLVSPELSGLDGDSITRLHTGGVAVVMVVEPDAERRWRRLGVDEMVDPTLDGLVEALVGAVQGRAAPPEERLGVGAPTPTGVSSPAARLLCVWGPHGAPGRTTVAVALAAAAAGLGRQVLLLDADPYAGAVAQHLGVLDEVSGLLAAARSANAGVLDEGSLAGHARSVGGPGLRVLTGLPRADRWPEVRRAAFEELLGVARGLADLVVVDTGFSLEELGTPGRNLMTLAAVAAADEVVVVGAADPVGLARLARGLIELREVAADVAVRVVVNRTRPSLGWADRDIRGMVEGFVTPSDVHFLPDDRVAADRALMTGRHLHECGGSPLPLAVTELAAAVLGGGRPLAGHRRTRRWARHP